MRINIPFICKLIMFRTCAKVDGGAGDKNVLIDTWYLDQIRACLAIRSVVVHRLACNYGWLISDFVSLLNSNFLGYRVCLMMAALFPSHDVEMGTPKKSLSNHMSLNLGKVI